jgi:hypothetical protein
MKVYLEQATTIIIWANVNFKSPKIVALAMICSPNFSRSVNHHKVGLMLINLKPI